MLTKHVIQVYGSRQAIAAALEITVQAVYQWGDVVPPLRAYQLLELRPDLAANPNQQEAA